MSELTKKMIWINEKTSIFVKSIQTCLLAARDASTQSWNQNS
jgi:hypothetical protein